ncbi:MAG: ISKra4 family transposase [Deltaproteobacteria bacterium]|nr:ISKra4 family transposase [Deltaproteobacteria bacterium]
MNALSRISSLKREYEQAWQNFDNILGYIDGNEALAMSHSELERELEKKGRELMRVLLQEHLNKRSPGQCEHPVKDADGVARKLTRAQPREIETVFGTVTLERVGYGMKGTESLHPLDAELNLPDERYSLELRRRIAIEAAKSSFNETMDSIDRATGGHVPKRQVEELVKRAARDFDAFYETRHSAAASNADTGSVLVVSVDGKGVTMLKRDLRQQTRKAAEERAHKMGTRLSKGEKKNAKRMACVATVYTIEPFVRAPEEVIAQTGCTLAKRPRAGPEQKRVWASLEKEPEQVIADALAEARHRDPAGEKIWVALVDGNKPRIRHLRRIAQENEIELTIVVDIIHVIEYLWSAGRAFHPESGPKIESWVQHRAT